MKLFVLFADLITFRLLRLDPELRISGAVHFFIEDTSKIFILLLIMIYIISLLRAGLDIARIRDFVSGKKRGPAYVLAALLGAVTPFCSCSSIPLFLGFTSAGIPLGITMSFLITSPMINEVAVILLGSMLGLRFTLVYVFVGIAAGVGGGFFIDLIGAEKYLTPLGEKAGEMKTDTIPAIKRKSGIRERHAFAIAELHSIFSRVWKWILIGVGLGAALHGFVPDSFISNFLGDGQWWSVPAAVLLGIPLYSNASGVIPVAEALLNKGLPVGTMLAFMMSVVAASFPEFVMLRQVMKPRLLFIFFLMLLVFFTLVGWIFNIIF
ncbi:MAG: permease [Spirochaetales bacterium]|nr:permease [Spirochaetales bacterium]